MPSDIAAHRSPRIYLADAFGRGQVAADSTVPAVDQGRGLPRNIAHNVANRINARVSGLGQDVPAFTPPRSNPDGVSPGYVPRDIAACYDPNGTFPSVHGCIGKTTAGGTLVNTDEDFVIALLEEHGVAAVHGTAFIYPGHFRISYATDTESLREACTRIQTFCRGMK